SGREKLCWEDIRRIRDQWSGRLVLKGILSPQDARQARDLGVDGIILSNHGGRQLDGALSPMRVLPRCAEIANGMAVMIDGGIRRGTDILKAFGLGARFCFIGRPFNYAAAVAGEAGVRHAIELLRVQLRADLGMLGLTAMEQINAEYLHLAAFSCLSGGAARPAT